MSMRFTINRRFRRPWLWANRWTWAGFKFYGLTVLNMRFEVVF